MIGNKLTRAIDLTDNEHFVAVNLSDRNGDHQFRNIFLQPIGNVFANLFYSSAFRDDFTGERKGKPTVRRYQDVSLQCVFLPDRNLQDVARVNFVSLVGSNDSLCQNSAR